jgi:RNA polymerase sigma-70 factor (ECF subfamily)
VHPQLKDLFSVHADFVWRTLLRMGVSHDDVADAVHDVFLIAHKELEHFEGRSAVQTWLFTICRSVAGRRRKRLQREREHFIDRDVDEIIDLRADVSRVFEHNQECKLLQQVLDTLATEQKNVFILFELESMTGEDISQALEIPLGTVYSRLQLARKAFRQALNRHQAKARFASQRAGGEP